MAHPDQLFAALQSSLRVDGATRAIVALPSIALGPRYAARTDLASFETRWLYWLLALREPGTRVAVVTSDRVPDWEVDYYLALIPDAPDARARLMTVALDDLSPRPLAVKLLERPDLLTALHDFAAGADARFSIPFNATRADRDVALATDIPIWGVDHRFAQWATKSGGRRLFEEEGVAAPRGFRDVRDVDGLESSLAALRGGPAVVKLDEGVTGDGNAILRAGELPSALPVPVLAGLHSGAVVEELVVGGTVSSPSVQVRLYPGGAHEVIATHDQILGGELGQTYLACRYPADPTYAPAIVAEAEKVARRLSREGAVGRFAVDFVVADGAPYAVEINLREGGTTHPHGTLELLGASGHYYATDAVREPAFAGVDGRRLIAALHQRGLAYDPAAGSGVVLYMLRALEREGRVGLAAFAGSPARAEELQNDARAVLGELAALVV
jgi:hypothetical protein